jgi:hypothetical protein
MAKATQILMAGLMGTLALAGAVQSVEAQTLKVALRVQNQAKIPNDVLAGAESAVTAIYANAGVELTFVDGPADVMVVLLSRHAESNMHHIPDAVGFAPCTKSERGHVAYVLQPRVDEIAEGYRVEKSVVLAAAIAHEVGHLLLPFNAHSKAGIMRADWNQADFRSAVHGRLLFTAEQAAQIHTRIAGEVQTGVMVW